MTVEISSSTKIEPSDFPLIAEQVSEELKARRERRRNLEKHWDEVDRQLRMEPELSHKQNSSGQVDPQKAWMPEVELPLQAQTLEMLMADSRRLMFPPNRDGFQARAALTDQYLSRWERSGAILPGERGRSPNAEINQDNADRLAAAIVSHWRAQYDFRGHMGLIDAQAFKYGFGIGRLRRIKRRALGHDARKGPKEQRIPVVVPRDARKTYLDDSQHSVMHEGFMIGPNIIQAKKVQWADLVASAKAEDGYVMDQIKLLSPDSKDEVELIELEGDLVIDRDRESVVERNVVVTIAVSESGALAFVRHQQADQFSSYLPHHYHVEDPTLAYGTAPLIKGMPVAKAAAQALNRVIEAGLLKNSPPIGFPSDNPEFATGEGPSVEPYAKWPDDGQINVYQEVGGEPEALFNVFLQLISLYYDVTGVNLPRLGAQTKSHTTAFAKDVELTQGSIRTVDYVVSMLEGPMTRSLELEYRMGVDMMSGKELVYIDAWNEFVQLNKSHLPDVVKWKAIGSGTALEEQEREAKRLASGQTAIQLDQLAVSLGLDPTLDIPAMIEHILNEGGWDVQAVTRAPDIASGTPPQSGVDGSIGNLGVITSEDPTLAALG